MNEVSVSKLPRIVCNFSCGAASAVATKLIVSHYPKDRVAIHNAFIQEEHPDNRRFLADCEKWFGHPITVLRDTKYNASVLEVFRRKRFFGGSMFGAPCSIALKKDVLNAATLPTDIIVLGFTAEEQSRVDRFLDANNGRNILHPLIDWGLTKADCLAIIERVGIELPMMYRMGYNNANCIGCVKGGEGYWNKIRRDFPQQFIQIADLQESIGPGAYLFRNRETGERYPLHKLLPSKGYHSEPEISCSELCIAAEEEIDRSK